MLGGHILAGPAGLFFVVAFCIGFAYGTLGLYYDSLSRALLDLDRHPSLMRLHLDINFAASREWKNKPLRSDMFRNSRTLSSMLVVAWRRLGLHWRLVARLIATWELTMHVYSKSTRMKKMQSSQEKRRLFINEVTTNMYPTLDLLYLEESACSLGMPMRHFYSKSGLLHNFMYGFHDSGSSPNH
jgi:hypothetical protein